MATFIVSIRITYDNEAAYNRRYLSVRRSIERVAQGEISEEMTSLYTMTTNRNSGGLADFIVANSDFDVSQDEMLIVNISGSKGAAVRGAVRAPALIRILNAR